MNKHKQEDDNGDRISRRELILTLRAMEWRLRFLIVMAVAGDIALSKVSNGTIAAIGAGVIGVLAFVSRFLHF